MSGRRDGATVELKPPPPPPPESPTSPLSSCVSSEQDDYSGGTETKPMMLVGCPRCLMYVMLSEEEPRCHVCKSTVLLHVIHDRGAAAAAGRKRKKSY